MEQNWKDWQRANQRYPLATETTTKQENIQCRVFLHIAGPEAQRIFDTFDISTKSQGKTVPPIELFRTYFSLALVKWFTLVLCGRLQVESNECDVSLSFTDCLQLLNIANLPKSLVRNMWDLEGIRIKENGSNNIPQHSIPRDFKIQRCDVRYEAGLLWKEDLPSFLDNWRQAECCLHSLEQWLAHDPPLHQGYHVALSKMENLGFIEEVENHCGPGEVFYLPHHPVIKAASESTKIRLV